MDLRERFRNRVGAIDWSAFEVPEGSAADVPTLLLALVGKDEAAAVRAANHLGHRLVYEDELVTRATVAALPALLEALPLAQAEAQSATMSLLCDITRASAGFLDPYRGPRRLPGSDALVPKVVLARGSSQGVSGALRVGMLDALPDLLRLAACDPRACDRLDLMRSLSVIARSLGGISDATRARVVETLRAAFVADSAPSQLPLLVALVELGAADAIAEPTDRFARWIWLTASPERARQLESVVLQTSIADVAEFDHLQIGLSFFVGLAGPLLEVAPHLQRAVAERYVESIRISARPSPNGDGTVSFIGLGIGALLLAFPDGKVGEALAAWQIDLLDAFFRDSFRATYTQSTHLQALRRLGVPTTRQQASDWLVAHGRPLIHDQRLG